MKKCIVCNTLIPEGRLKAIPTTTTCTAHSEAGRKKGIVTTLGEGDHTYNEIEIVDESIYNRVNYSNEYRNFDSDTDSDE